MSGKTWTRRSFLDYLLLLFSILFRRDVFEGSLAHFGTLLSPPTAGGGMFDTFFVLNDVCQLCQRMAKYAISIDNLHQNKITRGYVCQFGGPHNVGKHNFSAKYVFELFVHISVGLPRPLRTAFELKNELPTSIFTPGAATLTKHALN